MKKINKIIVFTLSMTTIPAYSGVMGAVGCQKLNPSLSCYESKWEFGANALYLQSSEGELSYPFLRTENNVNNFINENPSMWGFMLEGSRRTELGRDINLNWYHISNVATTNIGNERITSTSNAVTETGPMDLVGTRNWDAVNLEFAQKINYNENLNVRYHAGFEYAHIGYDGNASSFYPAPLIFTILRSLHFSGFGPRIGADASYILPYEIVPYINGAISLLGGSSKFNYQSTEHPPLFGRTGHAQTIVPEIELKSGIKYSYPTSHGDIGLNLGWMWVDYIDALHFGDNDLAHRAPFSLQGGYFGLNWSGNLL